MVPPLDVFMIDADSNPTWLGEAMDTQEAIKLILQSGDDGKFMVYSQTTTNKTYCTVREGQVVGAQPSTAA